MYAIEVTTEFCAAHALRLPPRLGGGLEPVHGHNFRATVRVESEGLDDLETVVDFHIVERALQEIVGAWANWTLNDLPPFDHQVNPSAERMAERIGVLMQGKLGGGSQARVAEVRLTEAPNCVAIWRA